MGKYISILIAFALCGCYTKKGCEELIRQDSIVLHDTIIVDSIHTDTVFNASVDTVILTKDKLTVKYIKVGEKVYLSGDCKADTIYKTKTVYFKQPAVSKWDGAKIYKYWFLWVLILGLIIGLWLRR